MLLPDYGKAKGRYDFDRLCGYVCMYIPTYVYIHLLPRNFKLLVRIRYMTYH